MIQSKRRSACEAASIGISSSVTACSPARKRLVTPSRPLRCASSMLCQSAASPEKSNSSTVQIFRIAFSYLR